MNFALGADELVGRNLSMGRYPGRARSGRIGAAELIGQAAREMGLSPRETRQLEETVMGRNAMMVKEREWDKSRMYILGFFFSAVPAGNTQTIVQSPQWPFRPYRLVIPSSIAPNVRLNSLNVGQQPAFAADGIVSGETFTEVAWGTHILLDTASPGINITMSVTNASAGALDIFATILGDAARD